jgi:DNA-binding response OmpR family regulator/two-component sensor histidine kinase
MLDLSKLESGKLVLHQVQSDIIPFVKYISESFNSLAEEAEIELTVYPEIEELYMDFDPQKLSTIVMNLISNAIKFTLPGGKIIIHLNAIEKNGKDLFIIKVKDNGTGISADELNNIFNRFHQVDNSSTRVVEGTGIGLALTRELTELMGGSIDVKSVLSKGSEFIVQLPVFRNESISNDLIISHKIPKTNNYITPVEWVEKMDLPLVLIIEDNEDVANYLKASLEEKYNLIYARDGDEGIQKAYERIPDVIISDVMMPGKDGYEVCSTLKNDERTDHIPIILLTAKASLQDKISGISYGADAYLIKPFNKAELFNRVEQLMLLREKMLKKVQQDSYSLLLKKQVKGTEAGFLKKAVDQVHLHINDHSFGSAQLAHKLHLSESQVYRKLKAITGKSTAIFIRSVRLQQAKELILNGDDPISSIAYDVGFNDPSWFSRAFKEEFGYAPSDLHK